MVCRCSCAPPVVSSLVCSLRCYNIPLWTTTDDNLYKKKTYVAVQVHFNCLF